MKVLKSFISSLPSYIDAQPSTGLSLSIYQIEATLPTSSHLLQTKEAFFFFFLMAYVPYHQSLFKNY